jgi:hypothetical protein
LLFYLNPSFLLLLVLLFLLGDQAYVLSLVVKDHLC